MAGDLILNSLEIQRFRCFRELRIERLGRVNLIVGKNNVGKSTLLEALHLFATAASPADLLEILASRGEVSVDPYDGGADTEIVRVRGLFFGRRAKLDPEDMIKVGPSGHTEECLQLSLMSAHELDARGLPVLPVPEGGTLFDRARRRVDEIPAEERRFAEVHAVKALIHTWLAWQDDPGTPLGQTITKRYFEPEGPHVHQLLA